MLVHQGTFDSNSSRINIFDVFEDHSPPSSTYSDQEPIEEEPPSPKKKAELYQWLNTSYYGSMVRKISGQTPYVPDFATVKIEDNSTQPIFENQDEDEEEEEEMNENGEKNSLLHEQKIQIDPQLSSTAHGSRTTETYEMCKSCNARYTRYRTTRYARIIWLALTSSFFYSFLHRYVVRFVKSVELHFGDFKLLKL